MIRINLLGRKKVAKVPFGLDEKLERLGINATDLQELRPGAIRIVVIAAALYAANYIPGYLHDEKVKQLDAEMATLQQKSGELQRELATKKDIRKQMDQLNKDEGELNRQLNAVNALKQGRSLAFNTLNDLVLQLQKTGKVWIEDFKYENHKISMVGRSWEYFPVNDFIKAISDSTRYQNVMFKEIAAEQSKLKPIPGVPEAVQKTKKFTLEFQVKEGD